MFGEEVRLYFIVLHPACSASRCWHLMTVLAKQRSPLALCCLRSRLPSPPSGLLRGRKPGWSQIIIQYSRNNSMIFPIPGGKKIGSHYLPRYTRYRVIAGRVIKGGHCMWLSTKWNWVVSVCCFNIMNCVNRIAALIVDRLCLWVLKIYMCRLLMLHGSSKAASQSWLDRNHARGNRLFVQHIY